MELYKLTAHELHDKLVNKEISSVELTNACFARIDEVEDQVKAYVTLDREGALAQAAKVDAKIAVGETIAPNNTQVAKLIGKLITSDTQ